MSNVNRGHLAGLQLALESLGAYCAGSKADAECVLSPLIAQASAAPEQEAAAWISPASLDLVQRGCRLGGCQASPRRDEQEGLTAPLYTHADDGEVERLRAENERLTSQRAAILLQARIWAGEAKAQQSITREVGEILGGIPDWGPISSGVKALRQQLAEAQALLRDADNWVRVLRTQFGYTQTADLAKRIDAFLSATAQPAECETCGGIGLVGRNPDHGELCPDCNQPAECETCNGSQVVATTENDHEGNTIEARCPVCQGYGTVSTGIDESPSTICNKCDGTGKPADGVKP